MHGGATMSVEKSSSKPRVNGPPPSETLDEMLLLRRMTRRELLQGAAAVGAAAGLAPVLAACGPSAAPTTRTLVYAADQTPQGLDPDFNFNIPDHQCRGNVNENLIQLGTTRDPTGTIIPDYNPDKLQGVLAEDWSLSDDGRTLTIRLRKGVASHYGNELTANDVQYRWDRGWALNAVGAFYQKYILEFTEPNWKVVDKYTWQVTTPRRNALLTLLMINNDMNILDSTEMRRRATPDDPWAKKFLTTGDAGHGAYHVTGFTAGEQLVFESHKGYWRGRPFFDKVILKAVPDDSNRLALLQAGTVDTATWLAPRFVTQAQRTASVKTWSAPGNVLWRLDFNWAASPLNNVNVRRALLYATPYDDIRKTVFQGLAHGAGGPINSGYFGYDPQWDTYTYDPGKASQLLAQSGGTGLNLTLTVNAGDEIQKNAAILVQSAFKGVGVPVTINELSSASFNTQLYKPGFQSNFQPAFPILPDAGYDLLLYYPCGSGLNATNFCDHHYDDVVHSANATLDRSQRLGLLSEAQRILEQDDAQAAYLAQLPWFMASKPSIQGANWTTENVTRWYLMKAA
jgi:ABC-type transport system substrate-binding protein